MLARIVPQRIRSQAVTCIGAEHIQNKGITPKQIFLIIDFDAEQVVHVLCLRRSDIGRCDNFFSILSSVFSSTTQVSFDLNLLFCPLLYRFVPPE